MQSREIKSASPCQLLTEGELDNVSQLSYSQLGRDLHRGRFSHSIAEHPTGALWLTGLILIIIILSGGIVYYSHSNVSEDGAIVCSVLICVCLLVMGAIMLFMVATPSQEILHNPDDGLFFLKLIATGYSWEQIGRIMNSYLFHRGLWWSNSCIYEGQQCYDLFISYTKCCTDSNMQRFIEQTQAKVAENMALKWDRIQIPNE
ncbi:hypothetical protein KDRO_A07620 [Kluyveromyces lactis]|nr:hypothetical protein KDRO_A07620 [Kluyveromyces lactis]